MDKREKGQTEKKSSTSSVSADGLTDAQVRALLLTFRQDLPFASAEAFSALQAAYSPLLRAEVASFRQNSALAELDREDLLQDASIVLLRAARRYDLDQTKVTFGLYLKICLRNSLISQLRHARSRKKADAKLRAEGAAELRRPSDSAAAGRAIFSDALSSDPAFSNGVNGDRVAESSMRRLAKLFSPPDTVRAGASAASEGSASTATEFPRTPSLEMLREELLPLLTRYEREVFRRFYAGMSYADIAAELSRSVKSVDNALFRIRKKWRAHFWAAASDVVPTTDAGDPPAED